MTDLLVADYAGILFYKKSNFGKWESYYTNKETSILEKGNKILIITTREFYSPFSAYVRGIDLSKFGQNGAVVNEDSISLDEIKIKKPEFKKLNHEFSFNGSFLKDEEIARLFKTVELLYGSDGLNFLEKAKRVVPGSKERISECLCSLIGLGKGSTPSGDDFVSGFLALYNSFSSILGLERIIIPERYLSKTNKLGSSLIRFYESLLLDLESAKLVSSLISANYDTSLKYVIKISRRGHSSGLDFCYGVICSYVYCKELLKGVKKTAWKYDDV